MNKDVFNTIVENYAEGIQTFADKNEVLLHIPLLNLTDAESVNLMWLMADLKRNIVIRDGGGALSINLTGLEFAQFTAGPDRRL